MRAERTGNFDRVRIPANVSLALRSGTLADNRPSASVPEVISVALRVVEVEVVVPLPEFRAFSLPFRVSSAVVRSEALAK